MFLHLGADQVIILNDLIAITDISEKSAVNENFIQDMQKEKRVVDVSDNHPKSMVITDKIIYLSAISPQTLKKRAQGLDKMDEEEQN